MGERIPKSYRLVVKLTVVAIAAILAGVLLFAVPGFGWDKLVPAVLGFIVLRVLWNASRRKRELVGRGFHVGRRVGTHWIYEEFRDGEVVALQLPLEYLGRGEYEIQIPGERAWLDSMPAWARERRGEIVERLGVVFKRGQMRTRDD